MANYYICFGVFRIALPLLLTICVIFRPCLLSALYLLFLLYLPFVPIPSTRSMAGHTGIYLKILLAVSVLTTLSQLAFQIYLLAVPPYADFLKNCETLEKILRHAGFVRLNDISVTSATTWLTPEIVILIGSIVVYVVCHKLTVEGSDTAEEGSVRLAEDKSKKRVLSFAAAVGKYFTLIALCLAAILRPSVQGGLYFLIFLFAATWWACYKELHRGFAIILRCLLAVVFVHIGVLYAYQFQWPQELLASDNMYARYFGLTPLMKVKCDDPREFLWADVEWASYINPIVLLWLYFMIAGESKLLLMPQKQKKQGAFSRLEGSINGPLNRQMSQRLSNRRLVRSSTTRHRWQSATRKVRVEKESGKSSEETPLIRGVSPSRKYGTSGKKPASILQDSTGSVTIAGEGQDDIPMDHLGKGTTAEEDESPTWIDNVIYGIEGFLQMLIRTSYILTNIIMMAWSITFHSWITFVLLLWANILWMIPNQRRAMLRSSPFLVLYAWFLLISAYVFSMDLNENELPTKIGDVELAPIGFEKVTYLPCKFLLVRCLYTSMFWITLRQYMKERREARQSSALADMVAPLQVTVGTAAGIPKEEEKGNKKMQVIGEYAKSFLMKFWIWIVAITLFAVAITGDRMTGFRIIYMALFLIFILTFQLSFRVWRKIMFGFWLTVILYSMLILILIYTYQFANIREYWTDYLHVTKTQQLDIGLEDYGTKQLFIRLVTPTFFVIITVIQLHYFHKDFMEISDPKTNSITEPISEGSSAQGGIIEPSSEKTDLESSIKFDLTDIGNVSAAQLQETFTIWLKKLHHAVNLIYLFLEIHLPKIVLLLAMLLCIYDKCAIYLIVVVFIVLSFTIGRAVYIFCIYSSSVLVSLMILARMLYQVDLIQHDTWNVTCENLPANTTDNLTHLNDAEWLGFKKSSADATLPKLVQWNIIYILAVTLWSVILVRQNNYRLARGRPTRRPYFMFPAIKRSDADKNLKNCVKYLLNYGYYKFGVEISFIATVAQIGFRMDMYSLFYAFWLCILVLMKRSLQRKVWNFFLIFLAVFLPIQYFMLIGLPPSLCTEYPWDKSETLRRLQEWAFLMDFEHELPAEKLIGDFILLLLVSRQALVFRIERRHAGQDYPGGSNESIIHHAEEKEFIIPVPDFITYCRSYLDVFKRGIFLSCMWITLAIMFLAGTNRVNIFSIGYLIGSFIFLWQGSDLYLRPIPKILNSWNYLLGYNVAVIFLKTLTQFAGCVYIDVLNKSAWWFVQLLAIGCVRKFGNITERAGIKADPDYDLPRDHIGLVWDGICFGFLLLQRRIFKSYNFFHMVNETKATTILASRGAELIEELRLKRMQEQDEEERRVLEKIKAKMDRIKATQQKIHGPSFKDSTNHFVAQPPLARSTSTSSCTSATSQQTPPAGYHTPIDEEDELPPLTPHAGSIVQTQVPSPFSAIMTGSLDAYLEPQRMSFSSPPNSELNPRPPSPDDSFPVFSPPPYEAAPPYAEVVSEPSTVPIRRQSSIGPPWMQGTLVTPRQSIISYSSRSPLSHHTYGIFPHSRPTYRKRVPKSYKEAIRSGDYYMFDDVDDEDLDLIEECAPSEPEDELDEGLKLRATESKRTIGELLNTTMKTDVSTAVRTSIEMRRRSSMPLSRQRSTMSARTQLSAPLSAPPTVGGHGHTVVIVDPKDKEKDEVDTEPQPGTSKDEDISELSEPKEQTKCQKILTYVLFVWVFVESALISLTLFLNKYSRDHRYVLRVLNKEKKILKEKTDYHVGLRLGTGQMWQPVGSYHTLVKQESHEGTMEPTPSVGTISPSDSYRIALTAGRIPEIARSNEVSDEKPPISEEESDSKAQVASPLPYSPEFDSRQESPTNILAEYEGGEMSSVDQPTIIRLLLAMWYIILSHSDILCYFMIFLNQIKSATFLSLPLPLMVFFWGTLTIPRPTKTFWVTIIAYTEIIVLIKCLFQFKFIPWNKMNVSYPFYPPRIIGIERRADYALWDLLLLLIVFFHRFLLKCLGLWKSTYIPASFLADGDCKISGDELQTLEQDPSKFPSRKKVTFKQPPPRSSKKYSFHPNYSFYYPYSFQCNKKKSKFFPAYLNTIRKRQSALTASGSGAIQPLKAINGRKGSDLQKLVEESEDSIVSEQKDDQSTTSDEDKVVSIRTERVNACANFSTSIRMTLARYAQSVKGFFKQLMDPTSRVAVDVYSYMFLCDFFNFFVILVGYSSFGPQQGDEGVQAYLEENRVPVLFLLMLILQFALIIVDRAIFLRKNIFGKVVFQFLQIILLHIWLFIMYPIITDRGFNSALPPQMYYMVKCFYLLLSAYQIRCGYPTRVLGNFICKGYNYLNMFLFKGFLAIPFLFELRTVMDWMWTDTSMTVFDWIKMEDIFAHVFQLKCNRYVESEYPQPRGERKSPIVKYLMGGAALALMIAIIWFPLVFFSLGNAVGKSNIPYDVTIDLRIGPYQPIYQMSVQSNSIYGFNSSTMHTLVQKYQQNKAASTFISNYEAGDIAAVKFSIDSATIWSISPPDRTRMIEEIKSPNPLTIRLQYQVSHKSNTKEDSGIIREETQLEMQAIVNGKPNPARQALLDMLSTNTKDTYVPLSYIFPKFIKVTNKGTAKAITQLMEKQTDILDKSLRNINIKREESKPTGPEDHMKEWWEIREECKDKNYEEYLKKLPFFDNCQSLLMYTFNDKIFPSQLNFITAGGIIGVYTTIVLVAGRLLRGFFAGMCFKIMFEDMPYVDRVLQLCFDIYLVRESREFCLEEDLFAKLVFLFRSPETLIKWTRPKEETNDEDDEEEDGNPQH